MQDKTPKRASSFCHRWWQITFSKVPICLSISERVCQATATDLPAAGDGVAAGTNHYRKGLKCRCLSQLNEDPPPFTNCVIAFNLFLKWYIILHRAESTKQEIRTTPGRHCAISKIHITDVVRGLPNRKCTRRLEADQAVALDMLGPAKAIISLHAHLFSEKGAFAAVWAHSPEDGSRNDSWNSTTVECAKAPATEYWHHRPLMSR